jgi:hypothetical protein
MKHSRTCLLLSLLTIAGLTLLVPEAARAKRVKGSVKATVNGKAFSSNQKRLTFATTSGFLSVTGVNLRRSRTRGGTKTLNVACQLPTQPLPVTSECNITFTEVSAGIGGGSANTALGPGLVTLTTIDANVVEGTIADTNLFNSSDMITVYAVTGGKFRVPVR